MCVVTVHVLQCDVHTTGDLAAICLSDYVIHCHGKHLRVFSTALLLLYSLWYKHLTVFRQHAAEYLPHYIKFKVKKCLSIQDTLQTCHIFTCRFNSMW